MSRKYASASGTTSGANEEIRTAIKTAISPDNALSIRSIEIYTDVRTDIKINGEVATFMAGITTITLSNNVAYSWKLALSEIETNITSLVIVSANPVKWAVTLIY